MTVLLLFICSVFPFDHFIAGDSAPGLLVSYDEHQQDLLIGPLSLRSSFSPETVIGLFGEPSRAFKYSSGEESFFYDPMGLTFVFNASSSIAVGISMTASEDDRFAIGPFDGKLIIAGFTLNSRTDAETLTQLENFRFECPVPTVCAAGRDSAIQCLVSYNQEGSGEVAQVAFSLNEP